MVIQRQKKVHLENITTSQNFSGPATGFGMQSNGSFNMPKFVKEFFAIKKRTPPKPLKKEKH